MEGAIGQRQQGRGRTEGGGGRRRDNGERRIREVVDWAVTAVGRD